MRTIIFTSLIAVASLPLQADDAAALKQAGALFPQFSNSLYTDSDKARETYDALAALGPSVQQRLHDWLTEEFDKKADEYRKNIPGREDAAGPSSEDWARIAQLRQQLRDIRKKGQEDQEKALKGEGWAALQELLKLQRPRGGKSSSRSSVFDPDPKKAAKALSEVKLVAGYRTDLGKKLGLETPTVDQQIDSLTKVSTPGGKANADKSRAAEAILAKNEALKDQIPAVEYEAILEVNQWRIVCGIHPLLIDPKLCDTARDHSKDMAEHNFFAHQSPLPGKKLPNDRAKKFGTSCSNENIATNGQFSGANKGWFHSPGHHKTMFSYRYKVIGYGIHGRHHTQNFR